ncbi:MAG: hypothetical protein HGA49_11455, partial [Eubacteriaceae bacterium]|nr:hypothetical protein [Eubacteriaceae bacterium]
ELILGTSRVIPLCIAASKFPEIKTKLRKLYRSGLVTHDPLQEFFYLVKDVTDSTRYSQEELRLCAALKEKGPLIYSEAAGAINKRIYSSHFTRLEKEGVIMRCGLTPTDMMHVKGDFDLFDTEAAVLGTEYLSQRLKKTPEEVAEMVYDKVKERLYFNIVRMLLEDKYPHYKKNGLDPNLEKLISNGWSYAKGNNSEDFLQIVFQMPASLVGVGAPIHLFLPDVAKALGTKCIIPEHAGVANALGAIVGNITAIVQVEVKPDPEGGFIVFGKTGNIHTHDYNEALKIATKEAKEAAKKEARSRGATGDISVSTERVYSSELAKQMPEDVFLSTTIAATAIGRVIL